MKTPTSLKTAANLLQAIRNDLAAGYESRESMQARVDAVGFWLADQKYSKMMGKLADEAHFLDDKINGGSGKAGNRLQVA